MKVKSKDSTVITAAPTGFVPVSQIVNSDDLHYRNLNPDFVKELTDDIETNGLDTPITTWGGGSTQTEVKIDGEVVPAHYLVAGLHRRAALLKFYRRNSKAFDAMFPSGIPVVHRLGVPVDMLAMQIRENVQRRDMLPEEIFPVLQEMKEEHELKNKEIAKKIGKSDAWVSQMLAVTEELDEDTQQDVLDGSLPIGKGVKIAASVRKERKAGKTVTKEQIREKAAVAKTSLGGRQREEKRVSIKKLALRYKSMPALNQGRRVVLLENALFYAAGTVKKLEAEWLVVTKPSKVAKIAKAIKAKK